jgi:hypothetical protein
VYQTAPGNNEFEASQGHTYGIASWLPFSGTCGWAADWNKSWYNARSDYSSLIGPNPNFPATDHALGTLNLLNRNEIQPQGAAICVPFAPM